MPAGQHVAQQQRGGRPDPLGQQPGDYADLKWRWGKYAWDPKKFPAAPALNIGAQGQFDVTAEDLKKYFQIIVPAAP